MDDVACRICGATVALSELRDQGSGGGCDRCEGTLLCERCGHPRPEHFGVFAAATRRGCATNRCECGGYLRVARPLVG